MLKMKLFSLFGALAMGGTIEDAVDKLPVDYIKCFYQQVFKCLPVQESHPICIEEHENFNPIRCAIRLNVCLRHTMQGIVQCVEENKPEETAPGGGEAGAS